MWSGHRSCNKRIFDMGCKTDFSTMHVLYASLALSILYILAILHPLTEDCNGLHALHRKLQSFKYTLPVISPKQQIMLQQQQQHQNMTKVSQRAEGPQALYRPPMQDNFFLPMAASIMLLPQAPLPIPPPPPAVVVMMVVMAVAMKAVVLAAAITVVAAAVAAAAMLTPWQWRWCCWVYCRGTGGEGWPHDCWHVSERLPGAWGERLGHYSIVPCGWLRCVALK